MQKDSRTGEAAGLTFRAQVDTLHVMFAYERRSMKKLLLMALLYIALLTGCGGQAVGAAGEEPVAAELFAMDTLMRLTAYGENASEALAAAEAELYRLEALLSIGREDSETSRLNRDGGGALSPDTAQLLDTALALYESTGGAFDITVFPLMEAWGFPAQAYRVPDAAELGALLPLVGSDKLDYDASAGRLIYQAAGMAVDFGGIAKGYTAARLMDIFTEHGVSSAIVSLGGNVQTLGAKPDGSLWRVGVQDPQNPAANIGILSLRDVAAVTSGGYQRYFEEDGVVYHHILDPKTGLSADSGLISATIVSTDGTLADGLSTAMFVLGAAAAADYWRASGGAFEMVLVTDDGGILVTAGLTEAFETTHDYEVIAP